MKRISIILFFASFIGCTIEEPYLLYPISEGSVTTNIGSDLITPQYIKFEQKIGELRAALGDFDLNRNQANLDRARQSWRDAHAAWEQTEAFIFGPALSANLTTHLDTFPVSYIDIQEKIKSNPIINPTEIPSWDGSIKGFHAIEYLLWGTDGHKQISDFTAKEFRYMRGVIEDMHTQSTNIRYAWDPDRNDYNKHIRDADNGTGEFSSSKEVLRVMVFSMADACSDLAERGLGNPLTSGITYAESYFSDNTVSDYYNTLIGIRSVYLGGLEESGYSISALVYGKDFQLDERVRQEIERAIEKINLLGPSFATSLAMNPEKVQDAKEAVEKLGKSLRNEVMIITQ